MTTKKPITFAQQEQLKCHLRSLAPHQLKCALYKLRNIVGSQLEASSKMISYKCYEFSIGYKVHKTFGYGRNETEAHINCIQNFLELLIEDETLFPLIKEMLTKNLTNETYETPDKPSRYDVFGKPSQLVDETLALDIWSQKADEEKEFLNGTELEIFKGNLGNISAIVQDISMNTSKLDFGDFLSDLVTNEKTNNKGIKQGKDFVEKKRRSVVECEIDLVKDKRESMGMKGNSETSTANTSNRRSTGSQENERRSFTHNHLTQINYETKRENELRRDSIVYRNEKENDFGNRKEIIIYSSRDDKRKDHILREQKSSRITGSYSRGLSKDFSKETACELTELNIKRDPRGSDGNCDCYKHLLEAMNKWEMLEREINRLSQENQFLKQLLVEKHKTQNTIRHMRSGSTIERSSASATSPLISGNTSINTQRRFTSHVIANPASMNKENEKIFNINLEQIVKDIPIDSFKKSERGISQGKRSYRNPSMEEASLRKCVPNPVRNPTRDGSLTERSTSNSTLVTRDTTNRDLSGQLSARTYYYKTRNW